ncbi:MAG TPA: branched-chain amino acid ABC transporter substrate-binding protein [Candidatus Limnocylindria bacterium]|nr:branched-chain amino acid ABC transporter substrate-binding protein [Candidatus Limnocylindria bacterium]
MKVTKLGALAVGASLVLGACSQGASTAPGSGGVATKGTVNIAIELPQQGSDLASSEPMINGIKLAVKDAGGVAGSYKIEIPNSAIFDDAKDGAHDPQTGAQNMQAIVALENVMAVIGPLNSSVAKVQIPISNEAGLLQCSPANTNEGLTKPEFGALEIRKAHPDKINYIRVVTTDDNQGPAAAKYILENLKKKNVYIIDDTETFGKVIADNFQKYLEANGGTVVARDGVPKTTTDYSAILTAAKAKNPEAIYFGGVTATGGARILKAAIQAGLDVPYVGPDGIFDGSAATKDSFLNLTGDDAKNAIATAAAVGDFPGRADFEKKFNAEYGKAPTGYAATAYACAQVVLDAIKRAGEGASMKELREKVRAAAVDTSVSYKTVIGDIKFDSNGDTSQKIISFYTYDPATKDWAFKEQLDFAK